MDIEIATEHICLQAVSEGLGTYIPGWFNENSIIKLLNIPKKKRVELIIAMGYPNTELWSKKRKELDQIRIYNCYKYIILSNHLDTPLFVQKQFSDQVVVSFPLPWHPCQLVREQQLTNLRKHKKGKHSVQ